MAKGVEGKQASPVVISRDELEYFLELLYYHEKELEAMGDGASELGFQRDKELIKSRDVIKRLVHL